MAGMQPGSPIPVTSVPNLRDLGGWPTREGATVASGRLFRSTDLFGLSDGDLTAFEALGIRTVYDLRTAAERTAQPDRLPEGTDYVVADVLMDSAGAAPAQLFALLSDARAANEALGGGRAAALFIDGYRQIATLPSSRAAYRLLFTGVAPDAGRPALFHCTTGKDRTGWAAAAILMLLGVDDHLVMQEYLLTNDQLMPSLKAQFDEFEAQGGDPALLRDVLGVRPDYLTAAIATMRAEFGSIEGYFADGLGIDAAAQESLCASLLESQRPSGAAGD
jgi:protein-tyrosine phosphatase